MSAPHRIVVKVGTSTLADAEGRLDLAYVEDLARQIAAQRAAGREPLLVTSGAIRAGRQTLGDRYAAVRPHAAPMPLKQAAAAIGQGVLLQAYAAAFARCGLVVAQVLLTREDLADRGRFLNARNTLMALLELGAVPVINENDTVAVEEIRFGDNDTLAARVAVLVEADLLLMLSDVEGLYADFDSPDRRVVTEVQGIDAAVEGLAGGAGSPLGTGGMRTKIEAARIAGGSGIRAVVAHGRRPGIVAEVVEGRPVGTAFLPAHDRLRGRKRWIVAGSRSRGAVVVNPRAAERLRERGASLLPAGITAVEGAFGAGDLVVVRDTEGRRVARGLTNYSADDLRRVMGLRSDRFEEVLGEKPYDEAIHRDNLVLEPH
ncbi:MAG TPA: glutamate 5-kinase [Chthonomonadales bacterium]|nr:glutamate 5-kinase [Chthonomonadales bacterium]